MRSNSCCRRFPAARWLFSLFLCRYSVSRVPLRSITKDFHGSVRLPTLRSLPRWCARNNLQVTYCCSELLFLTQRWYFSSHYMFPTFTRRRYHIHVFCSRCSWKHQQRAIQNNQSMIFASKALSSPLSNAFQHQDGTRSVA